MSWTPHPAETDFVAMAEGKLDGMQAFMSGKLKIEGNIMLPQKLEPILDSAGTDHRIMTADSLAPVLGERLRLSAHHRGSEPPRESRGMRLRLAAETVCQYGFPKDETSCHC